ncbi:hypothetical protein [Bacteroides sp.]|uniref:hypothetical protein n=1 Tax=Bacteroides sp. TaxID=29523 RepID=UPI0023BF5AE5|nr:hypothetical protein [Bacteroides sp.]MDE5709602.1 hypothetical protein [Bacteroides sp.]MDE6216893.1 hypothetical protein [Bacteroides sp.]
MKDKARKNALKNTPLPLAPTGQLKGIGKGTMQKTNCKVFFVFYFEFFHASFTGVEGVKQNESRLAMSHRKARNFFLFLSGKWLRNYD